MSDLFETFKSKIIDTDPDAIACSDCGSTCILEDTCQTCGSILKDIFLVENAPTTCFQSYKNVREVHLNAIFRKYSEIPFELQERLRPMFVCAQYELCQSRPKSNSLFYDFILLKLLEIIAPRYTYLIQMKRTAAKVQSYDVLWKELCEKIGWDYKPTCS